MKLQAFTERHARAFVCASIAFFALTPLTASAGPKIERWTLDSGARVYFVESHALPLIDISVEFDAGSARDPADKAGLAGLTRGLLDIGSKDLDEQQIAEQIADTGARIGGSTDIDRSSLTVRTLSSPDERNAALALAATLLAHPTFPAEAVERERTRSLAALRESLTRPATLANQSFTNLIYGDHPYAKTVSVTSLEGISRDDLIDFHKQYYTASNAVVTIVGDATRADAEMIASMLIRELPIGTAPASLPAPAMPNRTTERIANPSAQAHIMIGMPGMSRDDPDYFPLLVGNYVLGGGGFVSRLTKEVREQRGFAYSVFSYFQPMRASGPFTIGLQTRGSQIDKALTVVDDVLARFIEEGPTAEELQAAKDQYINGFGLRLDSNSKTLSYVSMIGFYDLPLDWLDTYPKLVEQVTAEQVRDAFIRRVKPEHLVTVVAGGDGDEVASSDNASAPEATKDAIN